MADPCKTVVVVGYPKSGNTWTVRLVADILNSPVSRFKTALPLATEGKDRPGDYYITQLHAVPEFLPGNPDFIVNAYTLNVMAMAGQRIIHVVRDPRDVAISVMYYWKKQNISEAIDFMNGVGRKAMITPYRKFVSAWYDEGVVDACGDCLKTIKYKDLHERPLEILDYALGWSDDFCYSRACDAIKRQEIKAKRKEIRKDGDSRPYGKAIQLAHLRKGIVGDWRNYFTNKQLEQFYDEFGDIMDLLGYEKGYLNG